MGKAPTDAAEGAQVQSLVRRHKLVLRHREESEGLISGDVANVGEADSWWKGAEDGR